MLQPLAWLQSLFHLAHQAVLDHQPDTLDQLQDELSQPPVEFQSHPGLIGLHVQASTALSAESATVDPATQDDKLEILTTFLSEVGQAREQEQRQQSRSATQQWRARVQDSLGVNAGWAHRWS